VPIALDPTAASPLGPMTTPNFTLTTAVDDVEIRVRWDGEPQLVVEVRLREADVDWRRYGRVRFPKDPDGQHRFEFTAQRFEGLVRHGFADNLT
jgi:hypothetical protein